MKKLFSESSLGEIASWVWQEASLSTVVALHGEMGSGKTTLVHAICEYLGVRDRVGSPTFSLINEYVYVDKGVHKSLYHIDLYRLRSEDEAVRAGVEDCLYSGIKCFVEWPERAASLLPDDTLHLYLTWAGDRERVIEIKRK